MNNTLEESGNANNVFVRPLIDQITRSRKILSMSILDSLPLHQEAITKSSITPKYHVAPCYWIEIRTQGFRTHKKNDEDGKDAVEELKGSWEKGRKRGGKGASAWHTVTVRR